MTTVVDPSEIDAAISAEMARLREEGELEVKVVPNCRACEDDDTRALINRLLSYMLPYKAVYLIVNDTINPARKKAGKKPITQRIIKNHASTHFDIDNPSRRMYRAIGEKHAKKLNKDYENGVEGAVTHLAYLEVQMHRGFESLVDPETRVDYMDGMKAAVMLADLQRKTQGEQEQAEMMAQMGLVIAAIKETVPEPMWKAIADKVRHGQLEGAEPARAISSRRRSEDDDDDDEFDPGEDEDFESEGDGG